MRTKRMPTQAELRAHLVYNGHTGEFTRVGWPADLHRPAGTITETGYLVVGVLGRQHYAQRLAWVYTYGEIPEGHEVIHLDGQPLNNRINNLHCGTRKECAQLRISLKRMRQAA